MKVEGTWEKWGGKLGYNKCIHEWNHQGINKRIYNFPHTFSPHASALGSCSWYNATLDTCVCHSWLSVHHNFSSESLLTGITAIYWWLNSYFILSSLGKHKLLQPFKGRCEVAQCLCVTRAYPGHPRPRPIKSTQGAIGLLHFLLTWHKLEPSGEREP